MIHLTILITITSLGTLFNQGLRDSEEVVLLRLIIGIHYLVDVNAFRCFGFSGAASSIDVQVVHSFYISIGSSGAIAASLLSMVRRKLTRIASILILVMISILRLELHSGLDCRRRCFQIHIEVDVLGWGCVD